MTSIHDVIIISHTHWDREWYRTFQQFRFRLIAVMDDLLNLLLEQPDYRYFLLDGQSILLEDYLAIRPERATDVGLLVKEGRLGVGPWYVQPDEFLSSGEALIRNLILGHRVASSFGEPVKVGWLPDTFGHIAQLPQILRGFDIETFVFSRGLGDHLSEPVLEFWWEAPSGSRVLALYQEKGYWNAGCLGYAFFWGNSEGREAEPELALARIKELVSQMNTLAASPTIAIWNGADHMPAQPGIPDLLSYVNAHLEDYKVRHGRVEDYARAVCQVGFRLPVVSGELRGSRYQSLLPGTASSRMPLKQANHQAERLLERYAEPLAALAWLAGSDYPDSLLWEGWRLLLQNHPHDSICGCSLDDVAREMLPRFEQSWQVGSCIMADSFKALAKEVATAWCPSDAIPCVVFNPVAHPRREVVELTLRLPYEGQTYHVVDHEGRPIQTEVLSESVEAYPWLEGQIINTGLAQIPFWRENLRELDGLDIAGFEWQTEGDSTVLCLRLADWPRGSDRVVEQLQREAEQRPPDMPLEIRARVVVVKLALMADLPACGYATYAVQASSGRCRSAPHVPGNEYQLENEHLLVKVDSHGGLEVIDKATSQSWRGLHQIEDVADRGDCYDFCPLSGEPGEGAVLEDSPDIELLTVNALVQSLSIRHRYRIPRALAGDRQTRSEEQVELPVRTVVTLKAGCRYLEILTEIDNQARDHRLRVLFPTRIDSDVVHADGHFAVVTRPALPRPAEEWHQPPSSAQPHHVWFGTDDGRSGLAILSEGLPEHAGLHGQGGMTLALTLFRSVGFLSRGDLSTRKGHAGPARETPEAQCIGHHAFRYGILPYKGDPMSAEVALQASLFDAPPVVQLTGLHSGTLPSRQSFVSLEPGCMILTALKKSETGNRLLMRFYNAERIPKPAIIRFGFPVLQAYRATLSETILERLDLSDGATCQLLVGPAEIVTLMLEPASSLEALTP